MCKQIIILALVVFCFCENSNAENYKQTIRGKVIDIDSKSPLTGANIILLNGDTLIGSATDADGTFRLENVPVGRRTIKVSSIGYEEKILGNIIITSAKEVVITIELREKVYTSEVIEIIGENDKSKANNDLVTVSARNFQAEETNRYAGSRGDPSKMVSNYAGVSSGNDAKNDIIVRGNSPLGVLWRLEGVDIPNPNHFSTQGATGGPISMLNNNLLGSSDFLTGAFPAEYGNKIAAVFDLRLRNGNNEKNEFTGQLGINGVELGAEGPISKKQGNSYIVNYRYSSLEVFNRLGISFGISGIPKYQDMSYKINIPTAKAGIFTFWGIGGISTLSILDSKRKKDDWSLTSKGEDLVSKTSMGAAGFSNTYFFKNNVSGKLSLAASASGLDVTLDAFSTVDISKFRMAENKSTEANFIAKYTVTDKINASHLLKVGAAYQTLYFNAHSFGYSSSYGKYIMELDVNKSTAGLFQSFVEWQFRPTEKITINSGIHYQIFLLNNTRALEPRLGLRFQLSDKQDVSIGYGMHSQMQPTIYYFYENYIPITDSYYRSNRNLDLSKSQHIILNYDYKFADGFRFKFETYYQYLYNIPVQQNFHSSFSMINEGNALEGLTLVDSLMNKGNGKNYGIEFTIEKFFSKHYYFLTTASVYQSKYKGSNNIEYHTSYDGGYVFNALIGYELGIGKSKNKSFSLDLKFTQAGGNRYTPIDMVKSNIAGEAVYIDNEAFSKKLKDYSRFDVKLSYKTNRKKISQSLFVCVENIFDTKNILRQSYNPDTKSIKTEYQFGLFPYGGYRIEF